MSSPTTSPTGNNPNNPLNLNHSNPNTHMVTHRWMADFEEFMGALQSEDTYMSTLTRSMALVLDEFYRDLTTVGVSAVSGAGMDRFFDALDTATEEYYAVYKPQLDSKIESNKKDIEARKEKEMSRVKKDILASKGHKVVLDTTEVRAEPEEEEEENTDGLEEEDFKQLMADLKLSQPKGRF